MKNRPSSHIRLLVLSFLLISLSSCASRKDLKDHSVTETSKEDKHYRSVSEISTSGAIIYKTKPVYYNTIFEKPCGEDGVLTPINTVIGSGNNKVKLFTNNGSLHVEAFIDSTRSELKQEFREKFVQDSLTLRQELSKVHVIEKETVKVIWPWWLWAAVIGGGLFFLLWLFEKFNIASRIRKVLIKI